MSPTCIGDSGISNPLLCLFPPLGRWTSSSFIPSAASVCSLFTITSVGIGSSWGSASIERLTKDAGKRPCSPASSPYSQSDVSLPWTQMIAPATKLSSPGSPTKVNSADTLWSRINKYVRIEKVTSMTSVKLGYL